MLPPPFTGVGTLAHKHVAHYDKRVEAFPLHNIHEGEQTTRRRVRECPNFCERWRQDFGTCGDWLAHGIDVSLGHGDRWTALVCVVQCTWYPVLSKCCTNIMMNLLLGASRDKSSNSRQNRRRRWRTIWLSTKIERFWFFLLVWKLLRLGTGTSATSNVQMLSPNMEKEKDVGQIIRKWQMFKTVTLFWSALYMADGPIITWCGLLGLRE